MNKMKFVRLVILIIPIFTILFYFIANLSAKPKDELPLEVLPAATSKVEKIEIKLPPSKTLEETVSNALLGTKGKYAVVIKNLKTGESFTKLEDEVFEPGSLYKLWVMAATFDKVKKGELKMSQKLSQRVEVLNQKFRIDGEQAELKEGVVSMSVEEALNKMITISHNYSALLLSEKVRNSQIRLYLNINGFSESDLGTPPKTTASDIALFLEKIYQGKLVDVDASLEMIELLKKQELNDGLPKFLDKNIKIAHKTGEIGSFKHDAGIIYLDKGDYIIVVLSESNAPQAAQERIALISKAVFEYFNSK